MSDARFFARGKVQEFREELLDDKKDPKHTKKRNALKRIVANMTMGNDMAALFPDVISCMQIHDIEIKKMVYLYVVNYAKYKPELVLMTVNSFLKDAADTNPLIRALAIRTMAYVHVDKVIDCLCEPLRNCCNDKDPYVRKTAAICVPKVYFYSKELATNEGLIECLKKLLYDSNPTVVANALAGLIEIHEKSSDFELEIDMSTASTLITALNECSEWGQTYIIEALMFVTPLSSLDAESLIERLYPRLQHANSGVVLATTKVIIYFLNYVESQEFIDTAYRKLGPPLVTITSGEPETQYVALRNIILIIQKKPDFLSGEMKVFFCKYNDPIFVKLSKLEVMFRLANASNVDILLAELKEYATEVDVDFVRKAVRSIGRCAIKIEPSADKCIQALVDLIQTKVNYVVQEAVIVIRDIFRKYPNRYESIIGILCENLDSLDEPEAKASMIWIVGQYADRIENSPELFEMFIETFQEEPAETQLAILTAAIKLFIKRPSQGKLIVPKVLKWATEETDNPDVRERGFVYWRLLSSDPVAAKSIVLSGQSTIYTEADNIDPALLEELLLHIDTLVSVTHKPPKSLFPELKHRQLKGSAIKQGNKPLYPPVGEREELKAISYNPYSNDVSSTKQTKIANLLDLDLDTEPPMPQQQRQYSVPTVSIPPVAQLSDQFGGLTMTSGRHDVLMSLAEDNTGYVAPKQMLLNANAGKGMEIHGTFARRNGNMFLEISVSNKALQPLSDFMIQTNKNSFGLITGRFDIVSPLLPNQTAQSAIPLGPSPAHIQPSMPGNQLHIAIKNNVGVFFFQCLFPLHILFSEDGKMVQNDYLQDWRETEENSVVISIDKLNLSNIDAFRRKLALNNIFTVAERQVDGEFILYSSSKLIDGTCVLCEIHAAFPSTVCSLNVHCKKPAISPLFADALRDILKTL